MVLLHYLISIPKGILKLCYLPFSNEIVPAKHLTYLPSLLASLITLKPFKQLRLFDHSVKLKLLFSALAIVFCQKTFNQNIGKHLFAHLDKDQDVIRVLTLLSNSRVLMKVELKIFISFVLVYGTTTGAFPLKQKNRFIPLNIFDFGVTEGIQTRIASNSASFLLIHWINNVIYNLFYHNWIL